MSTAPDHDDLEARARAHVIELREREGYPADPASVDAVLAARSPYGWITVAEHEAREVRRATLLAVVEAVEDYGRDVPEAFAGVAYSMAAGDGVHAGFTGDVAPHEAALRARVPDPSVLTVFPARWSFAELERLPHALRKDDDLRTLGLVVRSAEVDVRANALVVTPRDDLAAPAREAVERHLADRYAGAVVLAPSA